MDIGHMAPLFLIGIGIAAFGWGMVRVSADPTPAGGTSCGQIWPQQYPEYHPLYGAGVGAV
jgi:hypothetical protein